MAEAEALVYQSREDRKQREETPRGMSLKWGGLTACKRNMEREIMDRSKRHKVWDDRGG